METNKPDKPMQDADVPASLTTSTTTTARPKRAKPALLTPAPMPTASKPTKKDTTSNTGLHNIRRPALYGLVALMVVTLGFGGGFLGAAANREDNSSTSVQKVRLESQSNIISSIAKNVGQSVVSVNVTSQAAETNTNPFASLFGGSNGSQTEQSAGTGIILTSDGLIMTNRHVVPSGTTSVSVTMNDGTVYDDVQVIGRTSDNDSLDVAFLQIKDTKGKKLVPAEIGDSSKMKVGDSVIAIGNALGQFQNTVTSGIISGYGRSLQASASDGSSTENLDDLFQTDAAINEGNSGGPLVNLDGQVIGMNTAMASDSQSIGFAIPINDLSGLIDSVRRSGKLQRPYLGVVYIPITSDVKEQYNLGTDQGAYILNAAQAGQDTVISGGPADDAGVQPGDIITKVDSTTINENTSLTSALGKHKVGDKVTLTIVRDGKTITKNVTLGTAPSS